MDLLYAESCAQPAADLVLATSADVTVSIPVDMLQGEAPMVFIPIGKNVFIFQVRSLCCLKCSYWHRVFNLHCYRAFHKKVTKMYNSEGKKCRHLFFLSCSGSVAVALKAITFVSIQSSIRSIKVSDFICCDRPKSFDFINQNKLTTKRRKYCFPGVAFIPFS